MSDSDSDNSIEPLETNVYGLSDVGKPFTDLAPLPPLPLGPIFSTERDRYNPFQSLSKPRIFQYYLTYISALVHLFTMFQMNWWCDYSKIVLVYSFQYMLLHAFSWAIPTRRFMYWTHKRATFYYILAGLNMFIYLAAIVIGIILYFGSDYGLINFIGASLVTYQLFACTPMIAMVVLSIIALSFQQKYEDYRGTLTPTDERYRGKHHKAARKLKAGHDPIHVFVL